MSLLAFCAALALALPAWTQDDPFWHPWAPLDGGFGLGRPGVGTNADGRREVFIRGLDNALCQIWQVAPNGSWSGWNSFLSRDYCGARPARNRQRTNAAVLAA